MLATVIAAALLLQPPQETADKLASTTTSGGSANHPNSTDTRPSVRQRRQIHTVPSRSIKQTKPAEGKQPDDANVASNQATKSPTNSQSQTPSNVNQHNPATDVTSGTNTPLIIQPTKPGDSAPMPAKPIAPAVDPAQVARLNHLLTEVRQKLTARDQADANRLIAEAKSLATSPEQTDRVDRLAGSARQIRR